MIDLAEDKNRIVIGVAGKRYIPNVEETISRLPIPQEAVLIEVFGRLKSGASNKINLGESVSSNLLTRLTVRNTIRPLTGGLRIYNSKTGYCTLGMIAKWGHCCFYYQCSLYKPFWTDTKRSIPSNF